MFKLVPRKEPNRAMLYATPFLAVALTILAGFVLFTLLGKAPLHAMYLIFLKPLTDFNSLAEMLVKATPLILIAVGLSIGFRAGVWNIGAEGQFTIGAITGGSVALAAYPDGGPLLLPMMAIAGALGGMAWAAIPAFLRTKFNASEILVSLMLVYVATLLLSLLVHGPLRDPEGFNFPESRLFQEDAHVPNLITDTRAHIGFLVALAAAAAAYVYLERMILGFQVKVLGQAPRAARFAGYSEKTIVWTCFMISGALAGVAGLFEAAGPVGQLVPSLPVGYGFTAIIVAFLGRLHPVGIVFAGLLMALTYIGGETAQIEMSLPSATTSVFQGLLLFFLLATDVLVNFRVVRAGERLAAPAKPAPAPLTPKPAE
ncbi:ABC transporter permease [Chenggangzhangella methanolivorans]|uniref:ABC transporter permease n=1 Tax=Chenggangzhangella methanolivorans TaxID=1437009 RepID=A0A9E6UI07_9HYPH|nr:ABC transporter permease [Chenggangzhangella methanolivorans]QZO00303.1 ABC transporter permease [Chenggangzhangella methanolivorans]